VPRSKLDDPNMWATMLGLPFYTLGKNGSGANFTQSTSVVGYGVGLAGALAATANGGIIYVLKGAYTSGDFSAALGGGATGGGFAFSGSNQMIIFEPGSTWTFDNGLAGLTPDWYTGTNASFLHGLICMGGNGWVHGASTGTIAPVIYNNQWFIGNGLVINWGTQTSLTNDLNGFYVLLPGLSSSPQYVGAGGNNYVIDGVVSNGKIISFLRIQTDNYNSLMTTQTISQGMHVRNITATYQADANMNSGSAFLIQGFDGGEVADVTVDMSLCSVGDNDCLNVTGSFGETRNWTFNRMQLLGNGGILAGPTYITPIELQGNQKAGTVTGGCHDLTFIDCTFDSGIYTVGGSQTINLSTQYNDGLLIDDCSGGPGQEAIAGWVYNISFIDCTWVICPCVLLPNTTANGTGYNIVGGAGTTPYAFTNLATTADSNAVTRAWAGFFPMSVQVANGTATVTGVTINGNATGGTTGSYILMPGDVISVAYSGGSSVWPVIDVVPYGYIRFLGNAPQYIRNSSVPGMTGRGCGSPYGMISLAASPSSYTNLSGGIESILINTVSGITAITLNGQSIAGAITAGVGKIDLNYGDTLVITWAATQPKVYKQLK